MNNILSGIKEIAIASCAALVFLGLGFGIVISLVAASSEYIPSQKTERYNQLMAETGCEAESSIGVETKSDKCIPLHSSADKAIVLYREYNDDENKTNDLSRSEIQERLNLGEEGYKLLLLWMHKNNYVVCLPTFPSGSDCEWGTKAFERYNIEGENR